MATFAEIVADVKSITKRPDLEDQIKLAVKKATLKAHHSDFYPKDLYEVGIEWETPAFYQSLEYRTLIPRWRAFKYLRKYSNDAASDFFSILSPDNVLDSYGVEKTNICYLAGEMLEIKSSTEDQYMLLGCFLHPIIEEATYSSWIALDRPFAIIYEAAASIFKQTGFDEQASAMRQEVAEQYAELKVELTAAGW